MKIVVIGAGYWGRNYIKELGHNLAYVVETNEERAFFVKDNYGVKVYPELNGDFDGAIIVTPPDTHIPIALDILKQGKKVLIEKPLSHDFEECLKLQPYADKVMVGHIYLYHPEIEVMKSYLEDYPLNHIFCRRTADGPFRDWQNALWDLAPHEISILNYLFGGKPISINYAGSRDWASLHLAYFSIDALIYVSWRGGPKTRKIELVPFDGERFIFDDVATVLEVSPMRLMLNAFLEENWHDRCSLQHGLDVISVLKACDL